MRLDAEALQDIRWPNREALAWADAQVQTWASPQSILAALEKDGRDGEYQALLRRALEGGGWGMDWDFLLEKAMIYDHRAVGRLAVAGGADPNRRVRRVYEVSLNVKSDSEGALYASILEALLEEDVRSTPPEGVPLLLLTQANTRAQHFLLPADRWQELISANAPLTAFQASQPVFPWMPEISTEQARRRSCSSRIFSMDICGSAQSGKSLS